MISLKQAEKALGEPAEKWEARCFEIAARLVDKGVVDGIAVYGHYRGPIQKESRFFAKSGAGFVQHGWVVLPRGGGIVDPTRWCFEYASPYIFEWTRSSTHPDYDEGGNIFRAEMRPPVPLFDPLEKYFDFSHKDAMDSKTWNFVEKYLELNDYCYHETMHDEDLSVGVFSQSQVHWLATAPLQELGEHAKGVYKALKKKGLVGLIPIDNFRRVEEGRWP
jgi:hypothetical protein